MANPITVNIPFTEKLKIAFYGGFFLWVVSPIALVVMFFGRASAWSLFGDTTNNTTVTNSFNTYGGLEDLATQAAADHSLNKSLFFALIKQESKWNPNAVSPKGAIGLGQIMPATAADICNINVPESLYDPAVNLQCSAKILRGLINTAGRRLEHKGDVEDIVRLALAAYNSGVKATFERDSLNRYPETRDYVARIMKEVEL